MDGKAPAFPGTVLHADSARSDAELQRDVRAHHDAHPGVRFLVDTITAIHSPPDPVRTAAAFYEAFPPRMVMDALDRRPDLRARVVHAMTGGPPTLLRRSAPLDLAAQIELLEAEDLPPEERAVRAEADLGLSVVELYLKYLDRTDLCAYLPGRDLWAYESSDAWWQQSTDATRRFMAAEIKSIRRHKVLTDTELVDLLGNEVLERDLPLRVRTAIRAASRAAARDGRAFTDTDLFDCVRSSDGAHDLVDELVASVALTHLRTLVERAATVLGLVATPAATPQPITPSVSAPASAASASASSVPARLSVAPVGDHAGAGRPSARPPAGVSATTPSVRPGPIVSSASVPAAARAPSVAPAAAAGASDAAGLIDLTDDDAFGEENTNS